MLTYEQIAQNMQISFEKVIEKIKQKEGNFLTFELNSDGIRQIVVHRYEKCVYNIILVETKPLKPAQKLFFASCIKKLTSNQLSCNAGVFDLVSITDLIIEDLNYVIENWDDI